MNRHAGKKSPGRVAIVGAGRLGTALGIALAESRIEVAAVVCRRKTRAKAAARSIGEGVLAFSAGELALLPGCDVVIIATPDDVIEDTAKRLTAESRSRSVSLFHVSGSLPSSILRPAAPKGWAVGSFHPLLAVSEPRAGAAGLHGAYFCVEGEARAVRLARKLIADLGGTAVSILTRHKALYHAAAVMAAGHAVALFDLAVEMSILSGTDRESASRMLFSLTQSALRDLDHAPAGEVMTGPFARGDINTVQRHLSAIATPDLANARETYIALARHAVDLAGERGLDAEVQSALRELLERA